MLYTDVPPAGGAWTATIWPEAFTRYPAYKVVPM